MFNISHVKSKRNNTCGDKGGATQLLHPGKGTREPGNRNRNPGAPKNALITIIKYSRFPGWKARGGSSAKPKAEEKDEKNQRKTTHY